jgi:hypothetical protein
MVERELTQPGDKTFGSAQFPEFEVGRHEGVLSDILSVLETTYPVVRQTLNRTPVAIDQLAEALHVSGQGLLNQLCILYNHDLL